MHIVEPIRKTEVINEADICVVGGSCTGVFAAVRAAQLGAKVAIVEKHNCFGGVATAGMVNIWHSLYDNRNENKIIAGLTEQVIERLFKRGAVISSQKKLIENECNAYTLNTEELKIELDELIKENDIIPYLDTFFTEPIIKDKGIVDAIIVENKDGRSAIKADFFVDATGDGDLASRMGCARFSFEHIQPPTMCAKIYGLDTLGDIDWRELINKHRKEFDLKEDWGWREVVVGMPKLNMCAETHVFDVNCGNAEMLTYSEIEGRRQIRAYMDILRKYGPEESNIALASLGSSIGIRDSYHIECTHRLLEAELLNGKHFNDAIAMGSYRVDIHHSEDSGITFRYLDGTEQAIDRQNAKKRISKWGDVSKNYRPYYQIPYRSITPKQSKNVILAGRMLDSDAGAFGGIRVMVNMNQTGEAAGTAAYIAVNESISIHDVNIDKLRSTMKCNGSVII